MILANRDGYDAFFYFSAKLTNVLSGTVEIKNLGKVSRMRHKRHCICILAVS
jgi:hypothetical protein